MVTKDGDRPQTEGNVNMKENRILSFIILGIIYSFATILGF